MRGELATSIKQILGVSARSSYGVQPSMLRERCSALIKATDPCAYRCVLRIGPVGGNPNATPYKSMLKQERQDLAEHHDPTQPRSLSYHGAEGYLRWHYEKGAAEVDDTLAIDHSAPLAP